MHDKCHERVQVHVRALIPPSAVTKVYFWLVTAQRWVRRKSAITFPYIILMSSHSSTDPSQPILTHENWQTVPEVMQLLLGNPIMITGCIYLGFRGGLFGSQAAKGFIWAGIMLRSHLRVRCSVMFSCLLPADPVPDPFRREALSSRGFFLLPFLQLG